MRVLIRKASTSVSSSVRAAAQQLLPPIPLFRRLLRVHRYALPQDMRYLGDQYVKDEFRRHRTADNPLHIVGFLSQWKYYLDELEASSSTSLSSSLHPGKKLETRVLEKLSAQQIGQLYELLQATKSLYSPKSESQD